MKILVLGAGAIGSVFGGFLALAGHHIVLIGRQSHMNAIKKNGLFIEGIWGEHTVSSLRGYESLVALQGSERLEFDLILLTVKSYDTEKMLNELTRIYPGTSPVISLQNGLGNVEKIESIIGRDKTIGGRVIFGVEFVEPGRVKVTVSADKTMLGGLSGGIDNNFVQQVADNFTDAHIPAQAVDDIHRFIWGKVLYNCALNGLATLVNMHYGGLLSHEGTKDIMRNIVSEIFAIIKAKHITVDWDTPEQYIEHLFSTLIPLTFDHHPSMLQDIMRHKQTEIDALNGAIVKMGGELGMYLPYNWTITQLIKAKEQQNLTA
jgi:2-dehydropantoate 2-reductase